MSWIVLILSGMFEAGWAITLPQTQMFTRLWPSVIFFVSMILSVGGLAIAMKHLPVGPAYAVWAGVGAVTTAVIGMLWLGEHISVVKVVSIALIITGIVGLSLAGETLPTSETSNASSPEKPAAS